MTTTTAPLTFGCPTRCSQAQTAALPRAHAPNGHSETDCTPNVAETPAFGPAALPFPLEIPEVLRRPLEIPEVLRRPREIPEVLRRPREIPEVLRR
jgi:hypothetical protein